MEERKKISKSELYELIREYQNGQKEVLSDIVESNIGLVYKAINEKYRNYLNEFDDLVSVGSLAIIKCLDSYDRKKGAFSTYAIKFIDTDINLYLRKNKKHNDVDSLDRVIYRDEKGNHNLTLADLLGYKVDYDTRLYRKELIKPIRKLVQELPKEEREMIELSFGFKDGIPLSPRDVAKIVKKPVKEVIDTLLRVLNQLRKKIVEYKEIDSDEYLSFMKEDNLSK